MTVEDEKVMMELMVVVPSVLVRPAASAGTSKAASSVDVWTTMARPTEARVENPITPSRAVATPKPSAPQRASATRSRTVRASQRATPPISAHSTIVPALDSSIS